MSAVAMMPAHHLPAHHLLMPHIIRGNKTSSSDVFRCLPIDVCPTRGTRHHLLMSFDVCPSSSPHQCLPMVIVSVSEGEKDDGVIETMGFGYEGLGFRVKGLWFRTPKP